MTLLALCISVGCGADDPDGNNAQQDDPCKATELPADWGMDPRLGDAGDPANWGALPPTAIVASTYLRLSDTSEEVFNELNGPISAELMAPAPGLMGLSLSRSQECGTARTLTVWADEDAMMNFVVGPAHMDAIQRVSDVSRGGSITQTWAVKDIESMTWQGIVPKFDDHNGPIY